MQTLLEPPAVAKKKSEVRKHSAIMRVQPQTLDVVKRAAVMLGMSVADYADEILLRYATRDLEKEAKKLFDKKPS